MRFCICTHDCIPRGRLVNDMLCVAAARHRQGWLMEILGRGVHWCCDTSWLAVTYHDDI